MTYCLAIALEEGLVFCSDSRTNAGPDRVSTYSKMHRFSIPYDRSLVLLTAGNLATSQAVVSQIQRDLEESAEFNSLYRIPVGGGEAEQLFTHVSNIGAIHPSPDGSTIASASRKTSIVCAAILRALSWCPLMISSPRTSPSGSTDASTFIPSLRG